MSDDGSEFGTFHVRSILGAKGVPLFDLVVIGVELRGKGERNAVSREVRVAMFEGQTNSLSESLSVKLECHGEAVEVVKIFHATICDTQFDYGLQLFGDDGFARIGKQARRRQFKECRVLCVDGPGVMTSPKPTSICIGIRALSRTAVNVTRTPS